MRAVSSVLPERAASREREGITGAVTPDGETSGSDCELYLRDSLLDKIQ